MQRTYVRQRQSAMLNLSVGIQLLGSAFTLAGLAGCSDDDTSTTDAAPASATLKSLTASELTALCKELLPVVSSASTPAHQCTVQGLLEADEKSCAASKQTCVTDKTYDDWSKASCKDFAADGGKPKYACTTKVSDIKACYDAAAKWLNAINCKAADPADTSFDPPPACFDELQEGDCMFKLDDLMKDKKFLFDGGADVPIGNTYMCVDGSKNYEYDLGFGDACNICATAPKTGCCESWIACVNDEACSCYLDCTSDDDVCFKQCKISDVPETFRTHVNCVGDTCATQCGL